MKYNKIHFKYRFDVHPKHTCQLSIIIMFNFTGFRTPFNVFVHTDDQEGSSTPTETMNRGFCLDYVQQPCSVSQG